MAWLQQQLTRERPDTFTQTAPDRNPNPLQRRGGPYIFSQDVLQHRLVQRQIRHHMLQLPRSEPLAALFWSDRVGL